MTMPFVLFYTVALIAAALFLPLWTGLALTALFFVVMATDFYYANRLSRQLREAVNDVPLQVRNLQFTTAFFAVRVDYWGSPHHARYMRALRIPLLALRWRLERLFKGQPWPPEGPPRWSEYTAELATADEGDHTFTYS